jgi:hypothetical protein
MTIDLSGLPKRVTVVVGEASEIPLPSYADSGNIWSAVCVSGQGVAQVSVELGERPAIPATPGDGTAEPPPLTLVPERAIVHGLTPGEATWQLVLARPFGPSQPAARHDLQVTVVATS